MKCRECNKEFEPSRIKWFNRQGFCSMKCAKEVRRPIKAGIVRTGYNGSVKNIGHRMNIKKQTNFMKNLLQLNYKKF